MSLFCSLISLQSAPAPTSSSSALWLKESVGISIFMQQPIHVYATYSQLIHGLIINIYTAVGFLSIDCGSSAVSNYTNPLTGMDVIWTPDTTLWPDIGKWSASTTVNPLPIPYYSSMSNESQYASMRYFPTTILNQSKFCYTLPAIAGNYYLIRASFWYGVKSTIYETLVNGKIRFHVIVDNYEGVEIIIDIPQTYPWFEEMYTEAMRHS